MSEQTPEQTAAQLEAAAQDAGLDLEQMVGQAAGGTIYGMVRALVDRGMPTHKALRLAAFLVVDGSAGRGAVASMGMSERVARSYRAEIRQAMEGDVGQEPPSEYLTDWAAAVEDRMLWAAKPEAGQ